MATIQIVDAVVKASGPGGDITILGPVTVTLQEQRIALIGPNGSGKSTLARLLNGLICPDVGTVHIDGLDTTGDGSAVRRKVGFVFTDPESQLVMPTVAEDIALSLRRRGLDKIERRSRSLEVLAVHGLEHLADVSVHALSGGQKQMLAIAGVLATGPDVLVADEPTTLLDLRNTRRIADLLFDIGQQLVLVTHDLELAARCNRALLIDGGTIVFDGAPAAAVDHYRSMAP